VSNKVSSTPPAHGPTTLDSPGRSYAIDRPRHGGRASLIRQKSPAAPRGPLSFVVLVGTLAILSFGGGSTSSLTRTGSAAHRRAVGSR
jgi:hypothetical protein